jgi:hypothetical protein
MSRAFRNGARKHEPTEIAISPHIRPGSPLTSPSKTSAKASPLARQLARRSKRTNVLRLCSSVSPIESSTFSLQEAGLSAVGERKEAADSLRRHFIELSG